ncbi:hypothetical protein E0H54_29015 [Rhizobium leguminosarum bv. viciae]|nr:hypothetical protein E0H54_29015 [Rhizobium leguminosarum bv. viciae]
MRSRTAASRWSFDRTARLEAVRRSDPPPGLEDGRSISKSPRTPRRQDMPTSQRDKDFRMLSEAVQAWYRFY